ncbi:hypothetical protein N7495_001217, partial [Penicillium taxi]|uniref:uncharacterized protein n=1 Tax=Penicillium taxi TaxID=168475 RepID=UPI002544D6A1
SKLEGSKQIFDKDSSLLFQFKANVAPETIQDICDSFMDLGRTCYCPPSSKPDLKTAIGRNDHSPEGLQEGITQAFVVEFQNTDGQVYYLQGDLVHRVFSGGLQGIVEKVQAVDFTNRSF